MFENERIVFPDDLGFRKTGEANLSWVVNEAQEKSNNGLFAAKNQQVQNGHFCCAICYSSSAGFRFES